MPIDPHANSHTTSNCWSPSDAVLLG